MNTQAWRGGVGERGTAGRCGRYREWSGTDVEMLATCIRRGDEYFTAGPQPVPLMNLALPPSFRRETSKTSWTGQTTSYRWDAGGLDAELRATLPGPLFKPLGRELRLTWSFGNAPGKVEDLEAACAYAPPMFKPKGRVLRCRCGVLPALIVASVPIVEIEIVSYEHWTIRLAADGGAILWLPLLEQDLRVDAAALGSWKALAEHPPLACEEAYRLEGETLHVRQRFLGAKRAPLPPLAALLGSDGGLQALPRAEKLCRTLLGPYSVVEGDAWEGTVDLAWRKAKLKFTRPVQGELAPIPKELAYAGDVTWEPGSAMDQLLSLRVWAPLAEVTPKVLWSKLARQLAPPSHETLRASLESVVEPTTQQTWMKEDKLFEHAGDVSYDSDWYNGLTLSGLWAATQCADETIAGPAKELARAARVERAGLCAYFEIFHDWSLGCSWTDPRGELWNTDCSHNGLEGLLAEANLREAEGDRAGRDRMLYLSGKMAVSFLAGIPLADWCRELGFVYHDPGGMHLGVKELKEWRGVNIDGAKTKNPYTLAGNWPAWCALLRKHGPLERFRTFARLWEQEHPQRYGNWFKFYTGLEAEDALEGFNQEARVQAAVFYHLAPEVALRLWVLEQDPGEVERLFETPLNLAEQLYCRAGAQLIVT